MEVKIATKKSQNYYCECCDYNTSNKYDFNKHKLTLKHKKASLEVFGSQKVANIENQYFCSYCDYVCSNKTNYNNHINTQKHLRKIANPINEVKQIKHLCNHCNREFANSGGLWKHKKKCRNTEHDVEQDDHVKTSITPDIFMEFFKQSKELQNVLVEQNRELQNKLLEQNEEYHKQMVEIAQKPSTITTNLNNTTNNQFNLQFFLNETCKDAINITDFVNSLKLTVQDFETN
jgi:hypothetical protein